MGFFITRTLVKRAGESGQVTPVGKLKTGQQGNFAPPDFSSVVEERKVKRPGDAHNLYLPAVGYVPICFSSIFLFAGSGILGDVDVPDGESVLHAHVCPADIFGVQKFLRASSMDDPPALEHVTAMGDL